MAATGAVYVASFADADTLFRQLLCGYVLILLTKIF